MRRLAVLRHCLKLTKAIGLSLMILSATTIAQAKSSVPFFGLQIQGLSPIIAKAIGLENSDGVLVRDIAFPGPASRSDIRRGDVIVEINGKDAGSVEAIQEMMAELAPGTKVKATVLRRGKRLSVNMTLGAKPPVWDVSRNNFATVSALGITFAALTDKVQKRFNLGWRSRGVVVSLIDEEKAAGLDINVGDVIVQVNQSPVWKPTHIVGYLNKAKIEKKEMILLLIEGTDGFRFALLPVPQ